jgi:hypothetical protein
VVDFFVMEMASRNHIPWAEIIGMMKVQPICALTPHDLAHGRHLQLASLDRGSGFVLSTDTLRVACLIPSNAGAVDLSTAWGSRSRAISCSLPFQIARIASALLAIFRSCLLGIGPIRPAFALGILRSSDAQGILGLRLRSARAGGSRHCQVSEKRG